MYIADKILDNISLKDSCYFNETNFYIEKAAKKDAVQRIKLNDRTSLCVAFIFTTKKYETVGTFVTKFWNRVIALLHSKHK